jgi:bacillopeptidase F (M6 metalloprotease family)
MLSSSITRQVDLSELEEATLQFRTWYDIEEGFDYGYVAVSTDSGRTWETLRGTTTTRDDPNDSNYGHGYTGKSDGWLRERVDLTPFAGQRILLRFWYITDPGLNRPGWLIDEIAIPEIGYSDGAERGSGRWTVDGFVRSSNELAQEYIVRLVEFGPETTVREVALDARNRGQLQIGQDARRAVLIVSGATRWTSEPAPYRVRLGDGSGSPPEDLRDAR